MSGAPKRLSAERRRAVIEQAAAEIFAERGYHGASVDAICRRSGVSPPVLYDHFVSKRELHTHLLERARDDLVELWRQSLAGDAPAEHRIAGALEAWAAYVQERPHVPRMFFAGAGDDPGTEASGRQVRARAAAALAAMLAPSTDPLAAEMAAELGIAGLAGLAVWWIDHPEVPRERVVATAVATLRAGRRGRLTAPRRPASRLSATPRARRPA